MSEQPSSGRVKVRRHADRAHYDRATVHAILDASLICHLGVVIEAQPIVIPTSFARVGETLYVHGAAANQALASAAGGPICVTVTLLDGLVLSRSAFGHSMNYRSVMVLGTGRAVDDPGEHAAALEAVVEHLVPGRWAEVRRPTAKELATTAVVALDLSECSAKVRTGPPLDGAADQELPIWAGELPLRLTSAPALPAPGVPASAPEPDSVRALRQRYQG